MNDNTTLKRCSKCSNEFPATAEFFSRNKQHKDGLQYHCKTCCAITSRSWRLQHPDRARELVRAWYREHKEYVSKTSRHWHKQQPEKTKTAQRKYERNNPEKRAVYRLRHAARKRSAAGSHTDMDITILYINQNGKCIYCGCVLGKKYHVDHVVPLSRGGSNDFDNLALACPHCNSSKGAKLLSEWRR